MTGWSAADASLVELTFEARPEAYDDLERAAAVANQATYETLLRVCGDGSGPKTCTTQQLGVLEETRKLVQTANDILGSDGSTEFSLGLGDEGLAAALRWTAAEEASSQSRVAQDFQKGQLGSVNTRLRALRLGATGFSVAGLRGLPQSEVAGLAPSALLGPAGDEPSQTLSKLGGFLNVSYGWGNYDPTTFENAFDYDAIDLSLGVDYRFRPGLVAGLVAGYAHNDVDFDPTKSIVDGGIESHGFSLGAFGLHTWRNLSTSLLFNYQRMFFDIERFITYPSQNPNVDGANTTTRANTHSDAVTAALGLAYTQRFGLGSGPGKPFVVEPSARLEYTYIGIAGYDEVNVDPTEIFALSLADQNINSLEVALGLRLAAAWSTRIGVFFPYSRLEWRFQLETDQRSTLSQYSGLEAAAVSSDAFVLGSALIDSDYGTIAAGIRTIIRGGRQRELGGAVGSRLSVFAEYKHVFLLANISSNLITGGVRYSF